MHIRCTMMGRIIASVKVTRLRQLAVTIFQILPTNRNKNAALATRQTDYFLDQTCSKPTVFTRNDIIAKFAHIINRTVEHLLSRSRCCLQYKYVLHFIFHEFRIYISIFRL